jgi:xylan 1,4-beta-xylosidase
VGGPATAAADWVDDFLKHTAKEHIPVDFVSTHGYADDTVENLFGTDEDIPTRDRVCRAVAKVRGQIKASSTPQTPLLWTEWNVPGMKEVRDTSFVGPALANTIRECDGQVDMLSFWTFSDVFEEGGPIPKPFIGEFGLRAKGGSNKPSYYAFGLLHRLGEERIRNLSQNAIVTRRRDGTLAVAIWNLVDPDTTGTSRTIRLVLQNAGSNSTATVTRVDDDHGNTLRAYQALGSPLDPTEQQVEKLNSTTAVAASAPQRFEGGSLQLSLQPNALALVDIRNVR